MEMWIKTYWPIVWAALSTAGMLILALLSKTYAKREEVTAVRTEVSKVDKKVDELSAKVDSMATQQQITDLLVALERTNGKIDSLDNKIQPVEHLAQLLLQHQLNNDK
ncbi:DUF2730 family protein [Vibrio navarrensis]|uniref:DUF2730 family protein n=1 Tax=Vibrio navarrensis TaxID=29495 RepID=UPI0013022CA6|nr:DUF2730 family protein [Vibrio navarrensis]